MNQRMKWLAILACLCSAGADWPQYMRDSAHTGDAADEALQLPLGLVAQVKLEDAILSSPAVVGGLAYVVDQMGTAYCIDPKAGRIVWKAAPDGDKAMGSNTSSPCVAKGRVCYGTTAGTFHVLDARNGTGVKTVNIGWPIISSPTFANDSIYFQALDAVVRCYDLDGNEKWNWNHYKRYTKPLDEAWKEKYTMGPLACDSPHYGGGKVAVSGTRVVTGIGWDQVCLEDKGKDAELVWCRRAPAGRDGSVPMSSSISGDWVYTAGQGAEGFQSLMRFALKDGSMEPIRPGLSSPDPWVTPAVRGSMVTFRNRDGYIDLFDWQAQKGMGRFDTAGPGLSSQTLARDHCVATTLAGELLVFAIGSHLDAKALRLKTPHGKGIGSAPAISGGCVYFGCDDAYFYVYGPKGALRPKKEERHVVHEPRSKVVSATGKVYGWTSARGNPANTGFVDDPGLKPPLKMRWAVRGFGHFMASGVATAEGDVISVTMGDRMVTCLEQATGRLRWRVPCGMGGWTGLLVADGRVYVPRSSPSLDGQLQCLDVRDGHTLWTTPIGAKWSPSWASPLAAGGRVVFSHVKKGPPAVAVVEAWEAETGKSLWQVELNMNPGNFRNLGGSCADGCAAGDVVYFSAGIRSGEWNPDGDRKRGETVAIEIKTGKVLWRNSEAFITSWASCPILAGDRLLLPEEHVGLRGVSPKDGKVLWTGGARNLTRYSVGPDFIVGRGYGGHASKFRLEDGKEYPGLQKGGQLGGDFHACNAVALTANYSFANTVGGICVRDVKTGVLLWQSPGFAPRGCSGVTLSNGRVFWASAASGMAFCWEPQN